MKTKTKDTEEESAVEEATPAPTKQSPTVVVRLNAKLLGWIGVIFVIVGGLFFAKSLFVVAIVNGTPITRLAIVKELEKRSGKAALESIITKKLVDDELQKKNVSVGEEEVTQEIQKIEAQIAQQGGTLQAILDEQGMSLAELSEQIANQKKLEKLFSSAATVNDADVAEYIKNTKTTISDGEAGAAQTAQIKEQLRQQKLSSEIDQWIAGLKKAASIKYLKTY
ncbi:SurA N-terminal domain-containing protein [Candidatus Uhrbacteria bacterium]|nr:SurA N-terminal domain-containing protein [Candidatus Uhrbacteria bacterium]